MNDPIKYTIDGKKLAFASGPVLEFPFEISAVAQQDDVLVVLLCIPTGVRFLRNVYGVESNGAIRWQIEDLFTDTDPKYGPFGGMDLGKGWVSVSAWSGLVADLDPTSGRVIRKYWQER